MLSPDLTALRFLQPMPRGNPHLRLLTAAVKALFPFTIDPSVELAAPPASAHHTVRPVNVPLGSQRSPGMFFMPKRPTGQTVLFVHGTAAERFLPYYFFLRRFLSAGIQVFFFELDGHGRNPRPLAASSLVECVPAAWEVMRSQREVDPERTGIAGISLGGACALNAASDLPGVKAVATVATPHFPNIDSLGKLIEAAGTINLEMLPVALFETTPNRILEFVTTPMRVVEDGRVVEYDLLDPRILYALQRIIGALDPLSGAARLKVPYLVVNGEWDMQCPLQQGRDLHAAAGGPSELAIIARRNHLTIMCTDAAVRRTVDWFADRL